jgi:uncharacterized protein (DUF697 family)
MTKNGSGSAQWIDSKVLQLVNKILDQAIDGVAPLSSASDLAQEYRIDTSYNCDDERVAALIHWETSKNFTSGFLTGLGGVITLPVAVPAALGASWIIQGRMCGAIAAIYGHDLNEDRVKTLVLLALTGDAAMGIIKDAGINIGKRLTLGAIDRLPGRLLIELNKRVGFRLLTKAGEKGIINLTKMVPIVGGIIGGSFDAAICVGVGETAKMLFRSHKMTQHQILSPSRKEGRVHRPSAKR